MLCTTTIDEHEWRGSGGFKRGGGLKDFARDGWVFPKPAAVRDVVSECCVTTHSCRDMTSTTSRSEGRSGLSPTPPAIITGSN